MWYPNPNRIHEIFEEEKVRKAAEIILSYKYREVLQVLAWAWGILLVMVLSLLLVIRIAVTVPLPWHG